MTAESARASGARRERPRRACLAIHGPDIGDADAGEGAAGRFAPRSGARKPSIARSIIAAIGFWQ